MNLKQLSDEQLILSTKSLVKKERELLTEILSHLHEIDHRSLFAKEAYPSLFEYCVSVLGYSEAAASRRISSMRLLYSLGSEKKQITQKIENGSLSLTHLSKLQSFLKSEKKENKRSFTIKEKMMLLTQMEGKSSRTSDQILKEISPSYMPVKERLRVLDHHHNELTLVITNDTVSKLNRLKEIFSNRTRSTSYTDLIEYLIDDSLQTHDPVEKEKRRKQKAQQMNNHNETEKEQSQEIKKPKPEAAKSNTETQLQTPLSTMAEALAQTLPVPRPPQKTPPSEIKSLRPSTTLKQVIQIQSQSQCTFTHPTTGRRCTSKSFLEFDHITPLALGGKTISTNLRLLCRAHNVLHAKNIFGNNYFTQTRAT